MGQPLAARPTKGVLLDKLWKENIFNIVALRFNVNNYMYFLQIQLLENDAYLEYWSYFFSLYLILIAIIVQIVEREFVDMEQNSCCKFNFWKMIPILKYFSNYFLFI